MIANKYILLEKLNHGCFGSVYKAENNRTKELVAIKFENKNNINKSLKNEAKIYQYLGKADGFPQLKLYGTNFSYNYLVINLLGESLSQKINYYKAFRLKTVLLLGIQIFKRIQILHENFLLHRDIKTSNFVFDINPDKNKLYLIDFGFSKRYDYDGKHIKEKNIKGIIGSINFCSINIHNNIEPSRRDDIESCVYILLNMLFGDLEWFDNKNINEVKKLKIKLLDLDEVPQFIKIMLYYCRSMKFEEKPDYIYLINLLIRELNLNCYKQDNIFEWSQL